MIQESRLVCYGLWNFGNGRGSVAAAIHEDAHGLLAATSRYVQGSKMDSRIFHGRQPELVALVIGFTEDRCEAMANVLVDWLEEYQ